MISIINTISTANSTVTTAVSSADIMGYSLVAVVFLIFLLAIKQILNAETHKGTKINHFNNSISVAIPPLLFVFLYLVAYMLTTQF